MWELVHWLHLVAMAFFVGGQLVLAAAVVPALRGRDREGLRAVARRFGWGTLVAIGVLVATGIPLATHYDQWESGTLNAKLGLVVLAALLVGAHIRFPGRRELDGAIFVVSLAIVGLGVALAH